MTVGVDAVELEGRGRRERSSRRGVSVSNARMLECLKFNGDFWSTLEKSGSSSSLIGFRAFVPRPFRDFLRSVLKKFERAENLFGGNS